MKKLTFDSADDAANELSAALEKVLDYHFSNIVRGKSYKYDDPFSDLEDISLNTTNKNIRARSIHFSIPVSCVVPRVWVRGKRVRVNDLVVQKLTLSYRLSCKFDRLYKSGKSFHRPSYWLPTKGKLAFLKANWKIISKKEKNLDNFSGFELKLIDKIKLVHETNIMNHRLESLKEKVRLIEFVDFVKDDYEFENVEIENKETQMNEFYGKPTNPPQEDYDFEELNIPPVMSAATAPRTEIRTDASNVKNVKNDYDFDNSIKVDSAVTVKIDNSTPERMEMNPAVVEQARRELRAIMKEKDMFKEEVIRSNFTGLISRKNCMDLSRFLHLGLLESEMASVSNPRKDEYERLSVIAWKLNQRWNTYTRTVSKADNAAKSKQSSQSRQYKSN